MFRNTALDPVAEAGIYKKINEIAGDKTAVYINSPLFSCRGCDKIIVFHGSAVIRQGSQAGNQSKSSRYLISP
jgi:ATP-binding cassette subfamily B protein